MPNRTLYAEHVLRHASSAVSVLQAACMIRGYCSKSGKPLDLERIGIDERAEYLSATPWHRL